MEMKESEAHCLFLRQCPGSCFVFRLRGISPLSGRNPVIAAQIQICLLGFPQVGPLTAAHGNLPAGTGWQTKIYHTAVVDGIDGWQQCTAKAERDDAVFALDMRKIHLFDKETERNLLYEE